MTKILMGPQTLIYPMPALLVGANVNDKPNFMTVAWGGIANSEPPMISVALVRSWPAIYGITLQYHVRRKLIMKQITA